MNRNKIPLIFAFALCNGKIKMHLVLYEGRRS